MAVLDSAGKLVMEAILATKAGTILQFLRGPRGSLHVTSSMIATQFVLKEPAAIFLIPELLASNGHLIVDRSAAERKGSQ